MNSSRLAATRRRVAPDVPQVGEDLVVRPPVGVAKDARRCRAIAVRVRRGAGEGDGQLGGLAGRDRIGRQRQAGPLEELDEEVDALGGRHGEPERRGRPGPR